MATTKLAIGTRVRVLKDYADAAGVKAGEIGKITSFDGIDGYNVDMENGRNWFFSFENVEAVKPEIRKGASLLISVIVKSDEPDYDGEYEADTPSGAAVHFTPADVFGPAPVNPANLEVWTDGNGQAARYHVACGRAGGNPWRQTNGNMLAVPGFQPLRRLITADGKVEIPE